MARPKQIRRVEQVRDWETWRAQAEIGFNLADALWNYMKHDTRTVRGGRQNCIIFTKR